MKGNYKIKLVFGFTLLGLAIILAIPIPSLDQEYSKILLSEEGILLSAKTSKDGQWRLPIKDDLPKELEHAILLFEDQYFYLHPGINPISIAKAFIENWKAKRIVRGGSTITMQLMRMYRGNKKRSYFQKAIELLGAFKLELLHSKKELLGLWATIAPFGGNTVGASAASWRYFDRSLLDLSTAEYATLAILPNTPTKINMSTNSNLLIKKRNKLLKKLYTQKYIDSTSYQLAIEEEIDFIRKAVPTSSIHLLENLIRKHPERHVFNTTVNLSTQDLLYTTLQNFSDLYQLDGIENGAGLILDFKSNKLLAYLGNTLSSDKNIRYVDCVSAPRSYGSLLKPFLYTYALDKGYFLPNELIKDIPTNINGFMPNNFDRKFRGAVPMEQIISNSLNVPAVRVLNYIGVESFHKHLIEKLRFTKFNPDPSYHGLSIILGGAESNMWRLANNYKGLLRNYYELPDPFNDVIILQEEEAAHASFRYNPISVSHTIRAMQSVNRPREEQNFTKINGQKIAWKTGTSYGHKDAWAIGANDQYIIAIWIGNESGRGVNNLTGGVKAAPVLFKLFRHLDEGNELHDRIFASKHIEVCQESGMLKGINCNKTEWLKSCDVSHKLRNCSYHSINRQSTKNDTLFTLGPTVEYYRKAYNGQTLKTEPSHLNSKTKKISIVYPENEAVLLIPKNIDSSYSQVQFKANSINPSEEIYWFLNNNYVEKTAFDHSLSLKLKEGEYALQVNDAYGNEIRQSFTVVKR